MALSYAFYIDKKRVYGIDIGFSTNNNWEEALDDLSFTLPAEKLNTPYKMFSLVEIIINDGTESRTREYILIDDQVTEVSKYGYYKHDIYAIEYTDKLNKYLISGFASSKHVKRMGKAQTYTNSSTNLHGGGAFTSEAPFQRQAGDNLPFSVYVFAKTLDIKAEYNSNEKIVIPKLNQAYQATRWTTNYGTETTSTMVRSDLFITSSLFSHRKQISGSGAPDETVIDVTNLEGTHWIEFQVFAHDRLDKDGYATIDDEYVWLYRYHFDVVSPKDVSIYDVLMRVSNLVSKFGSVERQDYFEATRVFDISDEVAEYLRTVEAPEVYLEKATALQTLNFILTYVNGISRLNRKADLDALTVDYFNKSQGTFDMEEAVSYGSKQSADQLGTQGITFFEQALPTDMNEPNMAIPNEDWYKTVRAVDLQLTDTTFELKLDESKKLYAPRKLKVKAPSFKFEFVLPTPPPDVEFNDVMIDLTDAWVNVDEWNLKYVSENFPSVYRHRPFNNSVFEKPYKTDNLFWQMGDTSIKLSNVYGVDFKTNHIQSVIERACLEYAMTHMEQPVFDSTYQGEDYYAVVFRRFTVDLGGDGWWRDLQFYVEYITDNSLVVKHDKEDLEEVDFYSEIKINQDENIINLARGSRKTYGDLQRTSNKQLSFQRVHYKLSEQFAMGTTDINDLTVTNVETEWHNYFFISKYTLTKHFNRIGQATFIDQAYRPFNAYNKNIMKRQDNYKDYLMAVPPSDIIENQQNSLIHDRAVEIILKTLLGRRYMVDNSTKASTLLVKTDGTLRFYPEGEDGYRNFITAPLSSSGVKGGFVFEFSFPNNLSVGDLSTQDGNATNTEAWYNRAVRYTDDFGRMESLDFMILDGEDLTFESMNTSMRSYPLIPMSPSKMTSITPKVYFGMISLPQELSPKALVINKDTRTNYGLSYQVNVQSKYFGMYIFGQAFFSKNFIVANVSDFMNNTMYFYPYTTNPNYKIFEDLKVKEGYSTPIPITSENTDIITTAEQGGYGIRFGDIINTDLYEGWALGDSEGNLYVAHNGNNNGFDLIPTHFRSGVKEIGRGEFAFTYEIMNSFAELVMEFKDVSESASEGSISKSVGLTTLLKVAITLRLQSTMNTFVDVPSTNASEGQIGKTIALLTEFKKGTSIYVDIEPFEFSSNWVSESASENNISKEVTILGYYINGEVVYYETDYLLDVTWSSENAQEDTVTQMLDSSTELLLGYAVQKEVSLPLVLSIPNEADTSQSIVSGFELTERTVFTVAGQLLTELYVNQSMPSENMFGEAIEDDLWLSTEHLFIDGIKITTDFGFAFDNVSESAQDSVINEGFGLDGEVGFTEGLKLQTELEFLFGDVSESASDSIISDVLGVDGDFKFKTDIRFETALSFIDTIASESAGTGFISERLSADNDFNMRKWLQLDLPFQISKTFSQDTDNGQIVYRGLQITPQTSVEKLLPTLTPPMVLSSSCGSSYNVQITFRNYNTVSVTMYITIGGVSYTRSVSALSNVTVTRTYTYNPTSPIEITAYVTRSGYNNSVTLTTTRTVTCAVPNYEWKYKGTSTQQFCQDYGYAMIGTTCSVLGQTLVVDGSADGYEGCIEIICAIK